MELPLFALHSVLFPGGDLELRVFEERYLRLMEDVLPEAPFAIAAIRHGQEVGGSYDPYRVGVRVVPVDFELTQDGTYEVHVHGEGRIRLLEPVADEPYARWHVEPFPEVGGADPTVTATAMAAGGRFPRPPGKTRLKRLKHFAVQPLLETPGRAERLDRLTSRFRQEAGLLRALRERRER